MSIANLIFRTHKNTCNAEKHDAKMWTSTNVDFIELMPTRELYGNDFRYISNHDFMECWINIFWEKLWICIFE